MELLIAIFVIVIFWFFASGNFKTNMQDPNSLSSEDIENSIIELKKIIFITNSFEKKNEYQKLYFRLDALMGQILLRHRHFILDVEAKEPLPFGFFKSENYHGHMTQTINHFSTDFNLSKYTPEQLIYTCFFLWYGGHVKWIGEIRSDPKLMMKIIDHLITEKSYGPAIFMKGMVKKYGLYVYSECFPEEARQLFVQAQKAGVGSATIELEHLSKYSELNGVKSVN
jgi:hypothetical protein